MLLLSRCCTQEGVAPRVASSTAARTVASSSGGDLGGSSRVGGSRPHRDTNQTVISHRSLLHSPVCLNIFLLLH